MFGTALALSVALTLISQFGLIIGGTIGALLLLLASLLGLGWGTRKFKEKMLGRSGPF